MSKDMIFDIRLNFDSKNVVGQASKSVKEHQHNLMVRQKGLNASSEDAVVFQPDGQDVDAQHGSAHEGWHNAYRSVEQAGFNPRTHEGSDRYLSLTRTLTVPNGTTHERYDWQGRDLCPSATRMKKNE